MFKVVVSVVALSLACIASANQTPNGLIAYDKVVNIGQGNYIVYMPKLRGVDGSFYSYSDTNSEVKRDTAPLKASVFNSKTEVICNSFGFIRNYNAASDWVPVFIGEQFLSRPLEAPTMLKKHWWGTERRAKLVSLYCANENELPVGGNVHVPVIGIQPFPIEIPSGPHQ